MHANQFSSIVVPVDFSELADRALPVAAALGRRGGLPIGLVATISPGLSPLGDEVELLERGLAMAGCDVNVYVVESNEDIVVALSPVLESLEAPLLCLATHGRNAVAEALLGSGTEELLTGTRCPAVVVGPCADTTDVPARTLVCVAPDHANDELVVAARAWHATFGGVLEEIEVVTASGVGQEPPAELVEATHQLGPLVVAAPVGHDPVRTILDELDVRPAIAAVASHLPRGLGRIVHGSVGWELIRSSPAPVLVVPVD